MSYTEFQNLKLELSVKGKKGSAFIMASSISWFIITFIWSTQMDISNKSVMTFVVGIIAIPLGFACSKLLKTNSKILNNPLQPLVLWLNFAQLFYFPFLVYVLLMLPDYFVMTYAIITGAHLFPYAWLYDDNIYAIMAGIISASSLIIGLNIPLQSMYFIPLFTGVVLLIMFIILCRSISVTTEKWEEISIQITNE